MTFVELYRERSYVLKLQDSWRRPSSSRFQDWMVCCQSSCLSLLLLCWLTDREVLQWGEGATLYHHHHLEVMEGEVEAQAQALEEEADIELVAVFLFAN